MSDSDPDGLLQRARAARVEAARARRLADQEPDDTKRISLARFASDMEARAIALEKQAFTIIPPSVRTHATPQQMQQAQVTPAKTDESDETPQKSG